MVAQELLVHTAHLADELYCSQKETVILPVCQTPVYEGAEESRSMSYFNAYV